MLTIGRLPAPRWRVAGAVAAAALATACEGVSPFIDRSYVRTGAPILYEPVSTTLDHASGPYPGANVGVGSYIEQTGTHATGLEVEYAYRRLETGGPLDGIDHSVFGGVRRFWNLNGRIRPHAGCGAMWEAFHVHHLSSGSDPSGFGIWGDVGIDCMITAVHSIGVRLRDAPRYDFADRHHAIRNGVELALVASWNF